MSLDNLALKVLQAHGGSEGRADRVQVRFQSGRLNDGDILNALYCANITGDDVELGFKALKCYPSHSVTLVTYHLLLVVSTISGKTSLVFLLNGDLVLFKWACAL